MLIGGVRESEGWGLGIQVELRLMRWWYDVGGRMESDEDLDSLLLGHLDPFFRRSE